jgi:hypothetical protein
MAYLHHSFDNDLYIEAYHILEHDGTPDYTGELDRGIDPRKGMDRTTTGLLVSYEMGDMWVNAEYMFQDGNNGSDRIQGADAFAGVLGYHINKDLAVEYEYTYASGDSDSKDGRDNRYQGAFHFNHKYQGYADLVGFTNSIDHKIQLTHQCTDKTKVSLAHHWFSRENRDDSWYDAGGTVLRDGKGTGGILNTDIVKQDKYVSGSSDIGQELDVVVKHKYSKNLNFELGYSHFFQGTFVRETGNVGDMDFFYVQTMLKF